MTERAFVSPNGRTVLLDCREGTNDEMMARSCLDEDEYGLRGHPPIRTAADIGAHIGPVAIGLALDHPEARIVAVEPVAANVELLRANLSRNGVADRVDVVHGAATHPRRRTVRVAWDFDGHEIATMHRFVGNQPMPRGTVQQVVEVPAVSLAAVLDRLGSSCDLLVTDCEGAEYGLLADRAVSAVSEIRGEYHRGWGDLERLLAATHSLTRIRGDEQVGGFAARSIA